MERKYADRPAWKRIEQRKFHTEQLDTNLFQGYVSFFYMQYVQKSAWKTYSRRCTKIADTGFLWIQHFPHQAHYTLTTMLDPNSNIIQWYVDICKDHGVSESQIPWFQDLYLDIVVLPSGEAELLDKDELTEAYTQKVISKSDFELAMKESQQIMQNKQIHIEIWRDWIAAHIQLWNEKHSSLPIIEV